MSGDERLSEDEISVLMGMGNDMQLKNFFTMTTVMFTLGMDNALNVSVIKFK